MSPEPLTAIVVGAGHRAVLYASYAETHPDELRIVGVADPLEYRRREVAERFDLTPDQCYHSAEELAAAGRRADLAINGTMDQRHVPTSIPLLRAGYDLLLEKPFATHEQEMMDLVAAARENGSSVLICHVLRHSPFYNAIRRKVLDGAIGTIMSVETAEHVCYHHMAISHIRGKWSREEDCGSGFLMAKCCHDLDQIVWMLSGVAPTGVSSFGGQMYFNPAHAPAGAGTRCLVDCKIENECPYSARKHYLQRNWWGFYSWQGLEHLGEAGEEEKESYLKSDSPFGRCVWACDNTVVDHQTVAIEFENGATAVHNLVGGTARSMRRIHLLGTHGEIEGVFSDSRFTIRAADPGADKGYSEEIVDLNVTGDFDGLSGGHGGGDMRLMADVVHVLRGKAPSIATTNLEDSVYGHLIGFRAEQSRKERRRVEIPKL